jgi:hypothetical protein
LIKECSEREFADNCREKQKQFSSVYSRFKVPNYKKFQRINNNNNNNKSNRDNNTKKSTVCTSHDQIISLLDEMKNDIANKFLAINDELVALNNRIKILEIKDSKSYLQPQSTKPRQSRFKGLHDNNFNQQYFPTQKALDEFQTEKGKANDTETNDNKPNKDINETTNSLLVTQSKLTKDTEKPALNINDNNKRIRSHNDSSSSDSDTGKSSTNNTSSKDKSPMKKIQ